MSTMEFPTPLRRVIAGAEFLDQHQPDWVDLIDTQTLDVRLNHACILGQLGAHLDVEGYDPFEVYQVAADVYGLGVETVLRFGFTGERDELSALTAGWLLVIGARRAMARVAERYGEDEVEPVALTGIDTLLAELVVA